MKRFILYYLPEQRSTAGSKAAYLRLTDSHQSFLETAEKTYLHSKEKNKSLSGIYFPGYQEAVPELVHRPGLKKSQVIFAGN